MMTIQLFIFIALITTYEGSVKELRMSHPTLSYESCMQKREIMFTEFVKKGDGVEEKMRLTPCYEINTSELPRCLTEDGEDEIRKYATLFDEEGKAIWRK